MPFGCWKGIMNRVLGFTTGFQGSDLQLAVQKVRCVSHDSREAKVMVICINPYDQRIVGVDCMEIRWVSLQPIGSAEL
ncbi:hypothetical protein E1B28_005532 [Marasmius oreades]|uniref:Uncharacterized protein n=1 Tax=Marasmius oreades TaxID=181124 RepID=A0A9P7UUC4_9AGAR|nr:uncharacterized protein E1B28_005532 [Marasmius oreades]KAG7094712.1 hypothetical protein E1B28_005532 [Marasmius oreades]